MAIFQYKDHSFQPPFAPSLEALSQYSGQTKAVLSLLGDYWTAYYRDTLSLANANSGFITAASRQFNRLLRLARSSNILDIPPEQPVSFDLLVFRKPDVTNILNAHGDIESFFIPVSDITDISYLTVSLFESKVILINGKHYKIVPGEGIYFYVDIFSDPSISTYEYFMGDDAEKIVLLWGCSIALESRFIYERFGRFLYRKASDSHQYRWLIEALMRYYTSAKTPTNIQNIFDILYGMPYARYDGEIVESITYCNDDLTDWTDKDTVGEAPYIRIVTDKNTYYAWQHTVLSYKVGDRVPQFALLGSFNTVMDYINTPNWWLDKSIAFPDKLIADEQSGKLTGAQKTELMDKILKYNTVYIRINVTFETYATYRALIKDLFKIIKSGFPVYLYPYVEINFDLAFADHSDFYKTAVDVFWTAVRKFTSDKYNSDDIIGKLIQEIHILFCDSTDVVEYKLVHDGKYLYYNGKECYNGLGGEFAVGVWNLKSNYKSSDIYDMLTRVSDDLILKGFPIRMEYDDSFRYAIATYNGDIYYGAKAPYHDIYPFEGYLLKDNRALYFHNQSYGEKLASRFIHTYIDSYYLQDNVQERFGSLVDLKKELTDTVDKIDELISTSVVHEDINTLPEVSPREDTFYVNYPYHDGAIFRGDSTAYTTPTLRAGYTTDTEGNVYYYHNNDADELDITVTRKS